MQVDVGIGTSDRQRLAEKLGHLLADTFALFLKTQNFHWNVTGTMFQTLHKMFEEQYEELAEAVDAIAERIRVLGHFAPGNFSELQALSAVRDSEVIPPAPEMIRELIAGHEIAMRTSRRALSAAYDADDEATSTLVAVRLSVHEKVAWQLASLLEE